MLSSRRHWLTKIMRILIVFLLLGVACLGMNRKPRLVDILKQHMDKKQMNNVVPTQYPYTTSDWYETSTAPPRTHNPMEDELMRIQESFLFPGSHYLFSLVKKYIEYGMDEEMEMGEIKDYFELPESDMKDIRKKVFKVAKVMDDPESLALYVTRLMIKPILKERMKCPASILDMAVAKTLFRQYMGWEDESWYTMFRDLVPLIDPMLEPYADDIAEKGVHELHGYVFNDTLGMLFGFGLRDVAFASHKLYGNLMHFFSMPDTYSEMHPVMSPQDREHMLMDSMYSSLWEVMCPYSYDVMENHRKIVLRFIDEFEVIERERICMDVTDFLYRYVSRTLPGHVVDFENKVGLSPICDEIEGVISDVVKGFSDYENFIYSMNIRELGEMLKTNLSPDEWNILEEALRRMGFVDMPLKGQTRHVSRRSSRPVKRKH
ncbi:uncharacterized protein LOC123562743 [Mercenaria mercenaria]|uniref:uncharacterized protein LOC123562743 n=1 Tax=Mercenaria mercenaria TaxID=6596 RepID=UPI00234F4921|nr:uncharacterized protein LOC123562743 [Mercenaria mercenaria]